MPPAAMRRNRNIQMPKKISPGSTQDSSVVKKFWSLPPRYVTPYFSSSCANAGSIRVVTKPLGSPLPASLILPVMRVSVISRSSTLPCSRYWRNWLYGRGSVCCAR
jgi:hypothetical protein